MEDRTYVSGKMLRSGAAMVVIDLFPSVVKGQNDSVNFRIWLNADGGLESNVW